MATSLVHHRSTVMERWDSPNASYQGARLLPLAYRSFIVRQVIERNLRAPGSLATISRQSPDTMCYGVSFTLSSLAFSVHLLLLPTGSRLRLRAAPSLRAPLRSRSRRPRGVVRSRIPMLPFFICYCA